MKHRKRRAGYPLKSGLAVTAAVLTAALSPVIVPAEASANPLDGSVAPAHSALPAPKLDGAGHLAVPARTEIVAIDLVSGDAYTTGNPHEQMPGLSIVKLFIGQYIVEHGDPADIPVAQQMIRVSDDALATQLYRKYPTSISTIARDYGLGDTVVAREWGSSRTSVNDMAVFLKSLVQNEPNGPIATAIYTVAPVAADGYHQDYGTARLPGAKGTKFGWSNDRDSANASATIGDGYVIGAETYGTAQALTDDVLAAFPGIGGGSPENPADPAPALPNPFSPLIPDLPELPRDAVPELPPLPAVPGLPL